jgi:ATP-dependent DNA ligase
VKAIPLPMLAKPAAMPRRATSYAYEPKWDGFRAMLRTEHGLRVLSRRRWNMTPRLAELEAFPVEGVFDG